MHRNLATLTLAFGLFLQLALPRLASAQDNASQPKPLETEVDSAVRRGVEYLLSKQRDSGAIADRQYDTTMSALCVMALSSIGHVPSHAHSQSDDEAAVACGRALTFVLGEDRIDKNGYFGNRDGSRMYGHGVTTLMLTEMLGMGIDEYQNKIIHSRCQAAIDVILSAQNQSKAAQYAGGWRYTPNSNDSDLSVSVWQLLALRSAKNDGLSVPETAIARAVAYLKRSYTSRLGSRGKPLQSSAGFSYLPSSSNPTFAMTAAGLLAMQVCGEYESELVKGAADWLSRHPPKWKDRFFFYGVYYYAQGMHQRGGELDAQAQETVARLLVEQQLPDGSWAAPGGEELGAGKVYATCMALLSLSVKYHYLPIYQR
ncbi:MAG: terpene cyclase/mutase family protein [Aureliella sp.]